MELGRSPPPPIFTLRGHKSGVTALAHVEPAILVSADESGSIILWDQVTFRRLVGYGNVCDSKILSLKVIRLNINSRDTDVLVVQSRNDGVLLLHCDECFTSPTPSETTETILPAVIAKYATYESLFSRGDSLTIENNNAILAYPSSLASHLVTVRFLGQDALTVISGSAARTDKSTKQQQVTVFDINIREDIQGQGRYSLFVGYEDGRIVAYSFRRDQTETIPELNVTGLKIDVIRVLDLGLTDFVSAFDTTSHSGDLVCGSAAKELRFINLDKNLNPNIVAIKLSKPGTSVISIRPDSKLVAAGGWDNTIRLFSLKSKRLLVAFRNHVKQVSTILFIRKKDVATIDDHQDKQLAPAPSGFLMYCASLDGTISVFDIY